MKGEGPAGFGDGDGWTVAPTATVDASCGFSRPPDDAIVFEDGTAAHDPEPPAGSYAGASLSLARRFQTDAADRFGAAGTLSDLIEGRALVVGGVAVGTVTRNSGGRLHLTFSGPDADEDAVDAVLRQITYANAMCDLGGRIQLHWAFVDSRAGRLIAEGHTMVPGNGAPIWRAA